MAVDVKRVPGRRELRFESLDEVVGDAEALVASPETRTLGNWPLPRLLSHLTMTINNSIDGFQERAPWFIRLLAPLIKGKVLRKMTPGIRLPKSAESYAFPDAGPAAEALVKLRAAVARTKSERMTAPHPAFGAMTHDEWLQLHLRHCELHLSFATP